MAGPLQDFLRQHGISHRLTSVAFPHANCRAEVAVKSAKRLIRDNVCPDGRPDPVRLTRALLQYRNTPDRATGMSPAELLLGRQLRDFLPGDTLAPPLRTFTDLRDTWRDIAAWRERALCRRTTADHERLCARTADLPPLRIGQSVLVQNQAGNHPRQWDHRGTVIEALPFRQYWIRLDGSRRLTLRNRKFLRVFTPVTPASSVPTRVPATVPYPGPPMPASPRPTSTPPAPHSPSSEPPGSRTEPPPTAGPLQPAFGPPAPRPAWPNPAPLTPQLTPPRPSIPPSVASQVRDALPSPSASPQPASPPTSPLSSSRRPVPSPLQSLESGASSAPRRSTRVGRGSTSRYRDYVSR